MKSTDTKPWKGTTRQHHDLVIPAQFRMLCGLLNIHPVDMLHDFMNTAGMELYSKGKEPGETIEQYILQCGYGSDYYSPEDIQQVLLELRAISALWPNGCTSAMLDRHAAWRTQYYEYWYKKWYREVRRNGLEGLKDDQDCQDDSSQNLPVTTA